MKKVNILIILFSFNEVVFTLLIGDTVWFNWQFNWLYQDVLLLVQEEFSNWKTDSFVVTRKFVNFESIQKGELIGTDDDQKVCAENDSVIVFAHDCYKKGVEGYLLGHIVE